MERKEWLTAASPRLLQRYLLGKTLHAAEKSSGLVADKHGLALRKMGDPEGG